MNKKQKRTLIRIVVAIVLFAIIYPLPLESWFGSPLGLYVEFALFLVPYLIAGYDVLLKAARNIGHGQVFDENFLMSVATIGAVSYTHLDVYKRQVLVCLRARRQGCRDFR